jgi:phosphoadenosine phosphosulfate reductase
MALWRDGAFADNDWSFVGDDAPVGPAAIVSLARWRREAEALRSQGVGVGVGVEIAAGRDAQSALAEVADRPLVALRFEKFGDGRAFSYATLLRERYGFRGELRAVGDVLLDEIPLMLRCGFISFDVSNEATLRALREGRLPRFPLAYQPGLSTGETRDTARPWARRLAAAQ